MLLWAKFVNLFDYHQCLHQSWNTSIQIDCSAAWCRSPKHYALHICIYCIRIQVYCVQKHRRTRPQSQHTNTHNGSQPTSFQSRPEPEERRRKNQMKNDYYVLSERERHLNTINFRIHKNIFIILKIVELECILKFVASAANFCPKINHIYEREISVEVLQKKLNVVYFCIGVMFILKSTRLRPEYHSYFL